MTTTATRRAAPLDYTGRRHARITKSMKAVPRSVLPILTELRYLLADGETQPVSNAVLAARTRIGEGFVSAAVRWLAGEAIPYVPHLRTPPAHIFIERHPREEGMAGFAITMLAPPELRPRTAAPRPVLFLGDHSGDPLPTTSSSAAGCGETPLEWDHAHDPSLLFMHTDNESTKTDPIPDDHDGGGTCATDAMAPGETPVPDQLIAALASGHQALNPLRPILPG